MSLAHYTNAMATIGGTLPTELTDEIMNNLCGDFDTLSPCALVSRSWLPRSRYIRFRKISLTPRTADALDTLLLSDSSLAKYIQSIGIYSTDRISARTRSWGACLFLAQLMAVTQLAIFELTPADTILNRLLEPMALSSVAQLDLHCAGFGKLEQLLHLVCAFPRLEQLTWGNVLVMGLPRPLDVSPLPALRALNVVSVDFRLEAAGGFLACLLNGPARETLSALVFRVARKDDTEVLMDALRKVGGTLQHISIMLDCRDTSLEKMLLQSQLHLGVCSALQSCSLVFSFPDATFSDSAALSNLLAQVSSRVLHTLMLEIRVLAFTSPDPRRDLPPLTTFDKLWVLRWENVERALLREVCEGVRVEVRAAGDSTALETSLKRRCPALMKKRQLTLIRSE